MAVNNITIGVGAAGGGPPAPRPPHPLAAGFAAAGGPPPAVLPALNGVPIDYKGVYSSSDRFYTAVHYENDNICLGYDDRAAAARAVETIRVVRRKFSGRGRGPKPPTNLDLLHARFLDGLVHHHFADPTTPHSRDDLKLALTTPGNILHSFVHWSPRVVWMAPFALPFVQTDTPRSLPGILQLCKAALRRVE
jgi:hypothetical protein